MQHGRAARRKARVSTAYPLNIVGAGLAIPGLHSRRSEVFGCEHVVLAEGPIAARATVLRGARGVLLRRVETHGEARFEISVSFTDGRPEVPLACTADDSAVIACWRRYGRDLGLPLLLEGPDRVVEEPYLQIGSVLLGATRERGGPSLASRRRPRFLMRRKAGRLPDRPVVRREREIIARS